MELVSQSWPLPSSMQAEEPRLAEPQDLGLLSWGYAAERNACCSPIPALSPKCAPGAGLSALWFLSAQFRGDLRCLVTGFGSQAETAQPAF